MRSTRCLACLAAALLAGAACRSRAPLSIGDGYPRGKDRHTIVQVVQEAFDSARPPIPIRIEPWTVGGYEDLDAATEQAERFAATPGLIGVVGPAGSRIALLASSVYNAKGVTQLVPNATSKRLTSAGPWTFMLVPDDSVEGVALAEYALDSLQLARVTVMYLGDEYGIGLRDGVAAALRSRGSRLADHVLVPNQPCQAARNGELARVVARASVRRAPPDVVVLAVTTAVAACLMPMIAAEIPGVWFLAADGVEPFRPALAALAAPIRERFRAVAFGVPGADSATQLFLARARRILGREPAQSEILIYDGFMVLAAAAQAGNGSRAAVRRWVESLGRSRPAWNGLSGPIGFAGPRRGLIHFLPIPESAP